MSDHTFDYIVVGGGTAGAVIARRLVDAGFTVAITEAGPRDDRPEIDSPFEAPALFGSELNWAYVTQPQAAANNRILGQPRGRGLGGSTLLYGMLYSRGAPSDYDGWAAQGAAGWTWKDVEPYFRRLEDYDGPTDGTRGTNGPLAIHRNTAPDPLVQAYVEAAVQAGYGFNGDYNAGDSRGASFAQATVREGHRVTAWRAYAGAMTGSPGLTVLTDVLVTRVLVKDGAATGVEYLLGEERRTLHARKEVILCAGVFGTPQLLMLSGIGDAGDLDTLGIPVVVDLPGVGRNLADHVTGAVVWESHQPLPAPRMTGIEAQIIADGGTGLIQPDRQGLLVSSVLSTMQEGLPRNGFTGLAITLHPFSRGQVRLNSTDPRDAPLIDPGLLSDPRDVESVVDHILSLREIARQPALAEWIKAEIYPGPQRNNRGALRDYVRASADAGQHQVGTARMGADSLAVVDARLRLHGLNRLRVADASVMPAPPAGNSAGPVMMIAERAADFILQDR